VVAAVFMLSQLVRDNRCRAILDSCPAPRFLRLFVITNCEQIGIHNAGIERDLAGR
jgi:hypothetical protein